MQNRYVGDLGDFGKYGLLRALCGFGAAPDMRRLSLGVVWYLIPDEWHNEDGKHIRYLQPIARNLDRFRSCDPELYDALARIVELERNVSAIRKSGILPAGAAFHEAPLTFAETAEFGRRARQARLERRRAWLDDALAATIGCDR